MAGEKVTIKIPRELYLRLKETIRDTGFSSVTEFIVFIMRMVVTGGELVEEESLEKHMIKEVRERLKRLGYFD